MGKKKGFTLVEVIVVITIIVLLTSIILVSLDKAKKTARDGKGQADLKQIANAFEQKYTDQGYYPDLPNNNDGITNFIPPNDTTKLSPYLSPVPYTTGTQNYYWYDDDVNFPGQKFCVYFRSEVNPNLYYTCGYNGCNDKVPSAACPNF